MNVSLTPELEQLVQKKVRSGRYNSASEVVREALRLLEQRDRMFTLHRKHLSRQIEEGWNAAAAGDLIDGDVVFNRLEAELNALAPQTGKRPARK